MQQGSEFQQLLNSYDSYTYPETYVVEQFSDFLYLVSTFNLLGVHSNFSNR